MTQDLTLSVSLETLGAIANDVARQSVLQRYQQAKSPETLRRHKVDISLFEVYLGKAGHVISGLAEDLSLWQGVTYGLVSGFQQWLLLQGYAIGSVNVRVATIKTYCDLAAQANYIAGSEMAVIRGVRGYNRKSGRNLDEKRVIQRVGRKKAQTVLLSDGHVELLKKKLRELALHDAIVARDYLIFCLLADLGLRCGEVVGLEASTLDIRSGMLTFYRRKVDKVQTHYLKGDTLEAAKMYLNNRPEGRLLFFGSSHRKGKLASDGLTTRAVNKIISRLGSFIGVNDLSPHDLRHYWATRAIRSGTDIKSLQQAGGWNSPYMPLQYAAECEIANEGVKLG